MSTRRSNRRVDDDGRGAAAPSVTLRHPVRRCVALFLLAVQLGGCFRYVPVASTAAPAGARVAVTINDAGRVGMAESVGPGLRRIHGELQSATDSMIVVSMSSVEYSELNVAAQMAGERIEIPRTYVSEVRERQLARSRTWLTIALVAVGLAVATLVGISGFGTDDPSDRPGGGNNGENQ